MNRALRRKQQKMQAKQTRSALTSGTPTERLKAGASLHQQRKYNQALKYYETVLAEEPNHVDALYLKGASLIALKKYDHAIEVLEKSVALNAEAAPAQHNLGLAYKEKGMLDKAVPHLEKAAKLDPSNQLTQFHLKMAKEGNTDKASTEYVKNLYDRAAGLFEDNLLGHLDYKGPEVMWMMLEKHLPGQKFEKVMDLGCGTGLMGAKMREICGHMAGMDLSASMIEEAKKKKIYDELHVGALVEFLEEDQNTYDMITCVDVFIYLKELEASFEQIAKHLDKGGIFAYSLEKLDDNAETDIWVDPDTHRHKHKTTYVRKLAKKFGFEEVGHHEDNLRLEHGKPVPSTIIVLKKA